MNRQKARTPAKRKPVITNVKTERKDGREIGVILSGRQKKMLYRQKMREKRHELIPRTAQQTITYQNMYKDGICRVTDHFFTKTVVFGDINYQLALNEDKTAAFEFWCDFYNYFDSSISLQISCMSQYANLAEMETVIDIPPHCDEFDGIREEYDGILKAQACKNTRSHFVLVL